MSSNTKRLLVIWHSRTSSAEQAAKGASMAAQSTIKELIALNDDKMPATERHEVLLRKASEVTLEELLSAQAYLFCAPENLASLSGQMKGKKLLT